MTDIELIQDTVTELYDKLIGRVIARQPLSENESVAYHAIDFRIRLEMGALGGIVHDPKPYIDALHRVGLIAHARALAHAMRHAPLGLETNEDFETFEACEHGVSEMADAHSSGDPTIFERAVYAFWVSAS